MSAMILLSGLASIFTFTPTSHGLVTIAPGQQVTCSKDKQVVRCEESTVCEVKYQYVSKDWVVTTPEGTYGVYKSKQSAVSQLKQLLEVKACAKSKIESR